MMYKDIFEFQEKNPTKEERIKALRQMNQVEFDLLLETCGTVQGKIFYTDLYKKSKELTQ